MYGTIMMDRMTPAASMPTPYGGPWNNGTNPNQRPSAGCTQPRNHGTSTKIPQSPYTTLGTAASSSMRNATGGRIQNGASSARKIAAPSESGTAMSSASSDDT